MGNPVIWFEIHGHDPTRLHDFYRNVFGWTIDADNPLSYGLIDKADAGVAGGISGSTDPNLPGHVTVYVSVDDPDAVLKDIESRGGAIVLPTTEVVPGTTIALFTDPWGSLVGLSKA